MFSIPFVGYHSLIIILIIRSTSSTIRALSNEAMTQELKLESRDPILYPESDRINFKINASFLSLRKR